jgi:hypothetical protein
MVRLDIKPGKNFPRGRRNNIEPQQIGQCAVLAFT